MPVQKSGMPLDERLGNLIKQAEQAVYAAKHRVLRPFDLTVPQYAALAVLAEHPRISGANLARRCGVTAQAMNGVVSLLETRGLVARAQSEDHARVLLIQLTGEGEALLRVADKQAVTVERGLADVFTASDLSSLRRLLGAVIDTLNPALQETT